MPGAIASDAAGPLTEDGGPIRVVIVEDSVVVRGFIRRWLEENPLIQVVQHFRNGKDAVDGIAKTRAEVVILDIEMPEMDGLTALPLLLRAVPNLKVIMASTLTTRNADISLRALAEGATDYLAKPQSMDGKVAAEAFRKDLVGKALAIGTTMRRQQSRPAPSPLPAQDRRALPRVPARSRVVELRAPSRAVPRILAIGSSTGGPQALNNFLAAFSSGFEVPVVIVQHMPATFTPILAAHIAGKTGIPCAEAVHGEKVERGRIYLAPGNFHMILTGTSEDCRIELNQEPPESFCRPAVDPLFRTAARIFGNKTLCVVLTGMGSDGCAGAREVVAAGGTVCAQDEATSVVWGMPGAVAGAGLCSFVDPIPTLCQKIALMLKGAQT